MSITAEFLKTVTVRPPDKGLAAVKLIHGFDIARLQTYFYDTQWHRGDRFTDRLMPLSGL